MPNSIAAPVEIVDDPLAKALYRIGKNHGIKNILEIGSSNGEGSTRHLVNAVTENPDKPRLFCLEVIKERFDVLREHYRNHEQVICLNMASVGIEDYPSELEVFEWYKSRPSYHITIPVVLEWYRQERQYLQEKQTPTHAIRYIKQTYNIQTFDVVLIDGSEFTGAAELAEVYGAKYIFLDDINIFKNGKNFQTLLDDSSYRLVDSSETVRQGYAIFERASRELPIEFFTIVLNGMPYLPQQLETFNGLKIPWRWHIIEGVTTLAHDTAWSLKNGAKVPDEFHTNGLSKDGTTEWIDSVAEKQPEQVLVYRKKGGAFWDGKIEMVRAPLGNLLKECLLWQVDADELWTVEQIEKLQQMFFNDSRRSAAYFFCDYFVAPNLVSISPHSYANNLHQDWLRAWHYRPGMNWASHEPPLLIERLVTGKFTDVAKVFPFTHYDTASENLIFRHKAYVLEEEILFKEKYYGYQGAVDSWKRLQEQTQFPVRLGDYFPWVSDNTKVDRYPEHALSSFFRRQREEATQLFNGAVEGNDQQRIIIDGVFYQFNPASGIVRLWTSLLKRWAHTPFGNRLVVIDRENSAPRIDGISYLPLQAHDYSNLGNDQKRVEAICQFHQAGLFISTYYSRPVKTPSLLMAYDFIPERFLQTGNKVEPMWEEKTLAAQRASAFLCISENTQYDLFKYYPWAQLKPVGFAHLASDYSRRSTAEQSEFRCKYKIHRPFWLLVGARRTYKNADLFFAALRQFSSRRGYDIVCTASRELEVFEGTDINVHKLTLDDHEMQCAYSAAEALVYPSLYEGFGLPILEAMSCGCPVITCKNSSIPEVAGEAALYVGSHEPDELAEAMGRVQMVSVRDKLVEAGYQQAAKFNWESTARQCEEFISMVVSSLKWDHIAPIRVEDLQHQVFLRGCATLDNLFRQSPLNYRIAEKLIEKLESEFGAISRLTYFKRLLRSKQEGKKG